MILVFCFNIWSYTIRFAKTLKLLHSFQSNFHFTKLHITLIVTVDHFLAIQFYLFCFLACIIISFFFFSN